MDGVAPGRKFSDHGQWELCRRILAAIGFEFERGRLDRSTPIHHGRGRNDIRLTIRTSEDDPSKAVLTVLHEGGHALYDQGLQRRTATRCWGMRRAWTARVAVAVVGEPCRSESCVLALSSSGSRLVVLRCHGRVGRRKLPPRRQSGSTRTIRVDADEMSYHLHILLRYELEIAFCR